MASNYLQVQLDSLNASKIILDSISIQVSDSFISVFTSVQAKLLFKPSKIPKKLKTYSDSSQIPPSKNNEKPKISDSFTDEIEKAKAAKQLTKKLEKEMQEREKRKYEREQEMLLKEEQERYELEKLKELALKQQEDLKNQRLKELKEKSEARKREIAAMKEIGETEYKKVISEKPLYKKIQENYQQEILMPELEKKKAELAKKRNLFKPLDRYDILEHSKNHDELMRESEERRKQNIRNRSLEYKMNAASLSLKTRFTDVILEEEKKKKEELEKQEIIKKSLYEKKQQYAEIVKEMFQPTVDPYKQHEMQLIVEKLKHNIPMKSISHTKSSRSVSERRSDSSREKDTKSVLNRKWKENPMIPKPKPKREPVLIDYLGERRNQRKQEQVSEIQRIDWEEDLYDENLTENEKAEKLKAKAAMMEKIAKKHEINLNGLSELDMAGQVNEMYINSIKAKLAVLEQV
ncbi:unnamed protein product [Blepharisma stoltei]|uniref:Uncharacterized protein n=1 Tax=Blepharisma stoltei TaxID=1481888 RepID=A0AAU9JLU1_9CILI|nr:unnamed protein product [Blepharisma stoltei]